MCGHTCNLGLGAVDQDAASRDLAKAYAPHARIVQRAGVEGVQVLCGVHLHLASALQCCVFRGTACAACVRSCGTRRLTMRSVASSGKLSGLCTCTSKEDFNRRHAPALCACHMFVAVTWSHV